MLLCGWTIRTCWEVLNKDQENAIAESIQEIFKTIKKKLKPRNKLKVEPPNDSKKTLLK